MHSHCLCVLANSRTNAYTISCTSWRFGQIQDSITLQTPCLYHISCQPHYLFLPTVSNVYALFVCYVNEHICFFAQRNTYSNLMSKFDFHCHPLKSSDLHLIEDHPLLSNFAIEMLKIQHKTVVQDKRTYPSSSTSSDNI